MDILDTMNSRHAVRAFKNTPIDLGKTTALNELIESINKRSGLHIQLITNEPEAFSGIMARMAGFRNAKNYIALIGKNAPGIEERCGYFGEQIVLKATELGLNTCWVALTFNRGKCRKKCEIDSEKGEKLLMIIALGIGESNGTPHTSKPPESFYTPTGNEPEWFVRGIRAAALAPTAMNKQKFFFTLSGGFVSAESPKGFEVDLGIVKYHFEAAAGKGNFQWR